MQPKVTNQTYIEGEFFVLSAFSFLTTFGILFFKSKEKIIRENLILLPEIHSFIKKKITRQNMSL